MTTMPQYLEKDNKGQAGVRRIGRPPRKSCRDLPTGQDHGGGQAGDNIVSPILLLLLLRRANHKRKNQVE